MAKIEVLPAFPHVLLVTGDDVMAGDYRLNLHKILYANSAQVQKGSHHFWITYAEPSQGGGQFGFPDGDATPQPRHGIVRMGGVPAADASIPTHMSVMMQEVAHHWLVSSAMQVMQGGVAKGLTDVEDVTKSWHLSGNAAEPQLLGRDNQHWSAFVDTQGSSMDGQSYTESKLPGGGLHWWSHKVIDGPMVTDGITPVQLTKTFPDLDQVIMGLKGAAEPTASGQPMYVRWIQPRFTHPLKYFVGIFVAFSATDFIRFGFKDDFRTLVVETYAAGFVKTSATLVDSEHPVKDVIKGMALRIVRRDATYYFQARYGDASAPGDVLAAADAPPPEPDANASFDSFKTVAKMTRTGAGGAPLNPLALGSMVTRDSGSYMVDGAFTNFQLQAAPGQPKQSFAFTPKPAATTAVDAANLPAGQLRRHDPSKMCFLNTENGRLHLVAPFSQSVDLEVWTPVKDAFAHSATTDTAPKVLLRAPASDFAFGTVATVHRCTYSPWAGGTMKGHDVFGDASFAALTDLVIPQGIKSKWTAPPNNTYKFAFIVAAAKASDLSNEEIGRIDRIRKYWNSTFSLCTGGKRKSNSTLSGG